jgi:hypothetical protein
MFQKALEPTGSLQRIIWMISVKKHTNSIFGALFSPKNKKTNKNNSRELCLLVLLLKVVTVPLTMYLLQSVTMQQLCVTELIQENTFIKYTPTKLLLTLMKMTLILESNGMTTTRQLGATKAPQNKNKKKRS